MIRFIFSFSAFFLLVSSCTDNEVAIRTTVIMKNTTIYLQITNEYDCDKYLVELHHGSVEKKGTCIYQVNYLKAKGGQSLSKDGKLLKDRSPQANSFVEFSIDGEEIRKISYNEIMKLDFIEKDGEKIYQLKLE